LAETSDMAISITPVGPVAAASAATDVAPELVLQAGTVVNAQVQQVLAADLVRIVIANLSIEVATQVPLQQGQALQLAVSHTSDGIRLALVGQGGDAGAALADAVTLSPEAQLDAGNRPTIVAKSVLTPLQRAAVTVAAQTAASEQNSLAPLFANLGAVSSGNLPPKLQQAIAQVLAQQTSLDQSLSAGDIKTAFQKSGILLEASLASGSIPSSGTPDLKAALIVLRQTLQSALGVTGTAAATPAAPTVTLTAAAAPGLVPQSPEFEVQEIILPQARLPAAQDIVQASGAGRSALAAALNAGPSAGATLNLLQEALQELGHPARATTAPRDGRTGDVTIHTNTPPPPFRGALPTAQPAASPSIAPDAPLSTTAHHLLGDTDAALARQTLLQVASLPDRIDLAGPKVDVTAPSWNFEIPFVTPQGTAMAQFEISRDGGGSEAEASKRVWRARFSLDVEPSGPVHAQVSLVGDKTSVRMWAERPSTAAQLRAGAAQLSQQLSRAELQPGDIVIRDGTPPQPAPARAGHFLDRAL
jgi:hypothetical protein